MGCGTDVRTGYVNLDSAVLDGVDVVHDLNTFPYPFEDDTFDHIIAINVLEHLPDTIGVMEELWRISHRSATVIIRVPYWNSMDSITDPTHRRFFNEHTFEFFDPTRERCQRRPYYTKARFRIQKEYYYVRLSRLGYVKLQNPIARKALSTLARFLCNVVSLLEYELVAVK